MIETELVEHQGNQLSHSNGQSETAYILLECLARFFGANVWRTVDGKKERYLPIDQALAVGHDQLNVLRLEHKEWLKKELPTLLHRFSKKELPHYVPSCVDDLLVMMKAITKQYGFKIRKKTNQMHGVHYLLDFSELKKTCKVL